MHDVETNPSNPRRGADIEPGTEKQTLHVEASDNALEALIREIHATISEATWSKMPREFADSVDRSVYGG